MDRTLAYVQSTLNEVRRDTERALERMVHREELAKSEARRYQAALGHIHSILNCGINTPEEMHIREIARRALTDA
ncbi:hypothetical protein M3573_19525 [Bacillus safensis]|uniref:hypothetical protein n=1 Tax=Bacillus safensis TaxID=561879 RepID=UPI00203D6959|nr:hypothetical protein [Bacillus safensis]MCM3140472.1 hypothetical protein [Bacillus safensis]